jgi:hypothetical protein
MFPKYSIPAGFMTEIKHFSSKNFEISHSLPFIISVFIPEWQKILNHKTNNQYKQSSRADLILK